MKNRLRQIFALSATSWWILFQAWAWIFVIGLGLRFGARSQLRRLAGGSNADHGRDPSTAGIPRPDRARGEHLAELVDLAACLHPRTVRCLTRALTLQYLLGRRGLSADLRIGVRMEGGQLRAHAYLELGGEPLGETHDLEQHFKPLVSLSR